MRIKDTLMDSRAGRSMLATFGLAKEEQAKSFFSYKIGNRSKKKKGDYYLYFKKDNVSPRVVNNFAFNEMVDYGAEYGLDFLKFQLEQSNNKETFLKYLQVAIPNRKNNYSKDKHERLDFCLAWVNEQLSKISSIQKEKNQQTQIALINNIQIQNEANNFTSEESGASFHKEMEALKTELKNLYANNAQLNSTTNNPELDSIIERLERVDNAIGLFEFGQITNFTTNELRQFAFLLLALQSYQLNNNAKSQNFFTQLSKVDITRLFKLNFKYYNDKVESPPYLTPFAHFNLTPLHHSKLTPLRHFNLTPFHRSKLTP
jgi:hypothetical protein